MKLKLDENIPRSAASRLVALDLDVTPCSTVSYLSTGRSPEGQFVTMKSQST